MTIVRLVARLEAQRAEFIRAYAPLGEPRLTARPASGGWSVAEVIEHLALVEEAIVAGGRGRDGTPVVDTGPVPTRERLRTAAKLRLIYLLFAVRTRIRMPGAVRKVATPSPTTGAEAFAHWERARARLVEQVRLAQDLRAPLFKHPVAGTIDYVEGLRFIEEHAVHHRRQIERVLRG